MLTYWTQTVNLSSLIPSQELSTPLNSGEEIKKKKKAETWAKHANIWMITDLLICSIIHSCVKPIAQTNKCENNKNILQRWNKNI